MQLGHLTFQAALDAAQLLAPAAAEAVKKLGLGPNVWASPIDAEYSDTAAFCEHYQIGLDTSANCVIVEAHRADRTWYAAALILATNRADVNGIIRRRLGARRASFAPMDAATNLTGMEYGGITPIGLPDKWPILIDEAVMQCGRIIIGSGVRGSKLLVEPKVLTSLPNAQVLNIKKA